MTEPIKRIETGDKELVIKHDPHAESPRLFDGNVGTMAAFHGRYDLGDEVSFNTDQFGGWSEMKDFIEDHNDVVAILPLFLLDHGRQHLSTTPFRNKWDSGLVGYIYATEEDVERLGLKDRENEEIEEMLQDEVETYAQYLKGEVYGYILYEKEECGMGHTHKNEIDSCWGFYTAELEDSTMMDHIEPHLTEDEIQEVQEKA